MTLVAPAREWPDLGNESLWCCDSSSMKGHESCTCWEPVFDAEQQPYNVGVEPTPRSSMCGDCAFLPQSPERRGDFAYDNSGEDDLESLVESGRPFFCHTGMRRVLYWQHPSGATIPGLDGEYMPPGAETGVAYQSNGDPAFLCAGWHARRKVMERQS